MSNNLRPQGDSATQSTSASQPLISKRLTRPRWFNRRLLTGVVLVLISVAAGNYLFLRAAKTNDYYVAAKTIVPGQTINVGDLTTVSVNLGDASAGYLAAESQLKPGLIAVQTIAAGTLVGHGAVTTTAQNNRRVLSIALDTPIPSSVKVGESAEIWISPTENSTRTAAAAAAAKQPSTSSTAKDATTTSTPGAAPADETNDRIKVTILSVATAGGLVTSGQTLEISCDAEDVESLITAISGKARLTVVATGGGAS